MNKPALLLTRPQASAMSFANSLESAALRGVRLCVSPLIRIEPISDVTGSEGYAGVIFSSSNGVSLAGKGNGKPAYCIGQRTAEMAMLKGWEVATQAEDAGQLIARIADLQPNGPLIHLSGTHRRGQIAENLSFMGIPTDVRAIYDQVLLPLSLEAQHLLGGKNSVIVPLFSSRSAAQFVKVAAETRQAVVLAISKAVADELVSATLQAVHIARVPSAEEMRRGVEKLLRGDSLG